MGAVASRAHHGHRALPRAERAVLRFSRRAGERGHRRLRALRGDLRLLDRRRGDVLPRGHPRDAAPRLRPGLRGRRGGRGGHARRPHPALGAARDLRHRRRAVAAEALCGGLRPRLRARRCSTCWWSSSSPGRRPTGSRAWPRCRSRPAARGDGHLEAGRAVLLRGGRDLSRLVLAHRGRRRGRVRRDPDRLRHPGHGLARPATRCSRPSTPPRRSSSSSSAPSSSRASSCSRDFRTSCRLGEARGLSPILVLGAVDGALRAARHVPGRGEHDPDHRAGHLAARHQHRLRWRSGSASS